MHIYKHAYLENQNNTLECILPRDEEYKFNVNDQFFGLKVNKDGKSLAELSVNQFESGTDYYGINLARGFDQSVSIRSLKKGAVNITCYTNICPEALRNDKESSKRVSTDSGGTFEIVYCP
ncbi:unnamed protein product [Bursaphelenchus okinawaensis]|uniref:Uncharacterized protein n=1 Tax=Bursaphelenchus okinawaensis TaxID=465554 RepID=A0A811KUE9_9BILA|nr:unnamed protein product [Bursaphelenchus okinawaensis]CAG9112031.1 unnamed protein product [Bursaphelenchus okinawaensis]